jgi:phytoene dehydrogenase-like protein
MMTKTGNTYDVVIIGAGIGGLVCGCYLAKAGMKVLVVEQHYKPGGYCTSFKRKGFLFDAAAHSFGSFRKNGNMYNVLKDLDLVKRINIKRYTPSDIIMAPDYTIAFRSDLDKTVRGFQDAFPDEAEMLKDFFSYQVSARPIDFVTLRKKTFKDLLDQYFHDDKLKAMLSVPIFGNGALPPSLISAFTGSKIFSEFLLDGGYYPEDGMQALPDLLTSRLKELGSAVWLSSPVKKIVVKNNRVSGVMLGEKGFLPSKYVVSNCDARQTFLTLLGRRVVKTNIIDTVNSMIPSLSTFIIYLGIDKALKSCLKPGTNVWFMPHYDLEGGYLAAKQGAFDRIGYMIRLSPDKRTILAFVNAPFKTGSYWSRNKKSMLESFIKRIEKHLVPELSKHIVYADAATPHTLYRYTLNYQGAAYGWASTPSQLFTPELRQITPVQGLYLTGHWTTQTQGIPGVAYLGYDTAKFILRKEKS